MMRDWRGFLLEKAGEWGLPQSGQWKFLYSNNYRPNYSTLAVLWFHDGSAFPRAVTKIFREPEIPQREFESLSRVYAAAPDYVPRPLHCGLRAGFWTLWMTGVPGLRLRALRGQPPARLFSVVNMIADLHRAVLDRAGTTDPGRHQRIVSRPLETLTQFGSSPIVREGCARLASAAAAEWLQALPVVPQHGDLFADNVLMDSASRPYVIDWESFGLIDLPFYDLFTFLLSILRTGGQRPELWDSALVRRIPALVQQYSGLLGWRQADAPMLLALTLANWFHLQWADGRQEFCNLMYQAIEHYFEHRDQWERVFVASSQN